MMTAARSRSESMATQAMTAPIPNVPTSPGNTLDGYLLKNKKARRAPTNGVRMMYPMGFSERTAKNNRARAIMAEEPASCPFKPANMFTALAEAVTAKGSIIA